MLALTLSIFDSLSLLSVVTFERVCLPRYSDFHRRAIAKKSKATQAINEDTLQCVYKNMKIRLNFVVRERSGPFEHLVD